MSDQWHILVVENEESLNWSTVDSLRRDGYSVQSVKSGAEAVRTLWTEEYDLIISELKMRGADGFELLQWVRKNRSKTRLVMVTAFASVPARDEVLEGGVVSYLEKPFDLRTLKEEVRRLMQQSGFSAKLDAFDLLEVIQVITMGRKSIALLVNTGLGEQGVLRFQAGELVWAEYGSLRGEGAFFALAVHKHGTVMYQPWNEQITPNVTEPLSRLIFQALRHRTKDTGAPKAVAPGFLAQDQDDDSPFWPLAQDQDDDSPFVLLAEPQAPVTSSGHGVDEAIEWWQQPVRNASTDIGGNGVTGGGGVNGGLVPIVVQKVPGSQRAELPGWLTEQPTMHNPSLPSLSNSAQAAGSPVLKRDASKLVSILQMLRYSISGFRATAVISLDGQAIAQVVKDELDVAPLYGYFSMLQGALRSLEQAGGEDYEDMVITSVDRHSLLRFVGNDRDTFHLLITTRATDPLKSLAVMVSVEGAITAALR